VTHPVDAGTQGFPASRGPIISKRDVLAEDEILEEILGTLDDRRARWESEVRAEVGAAISRIGLDWGREDYSKRLDADKRADLIKSALAHPAARAIVEGYLAHLQEHRAEFYAAVLGASEAPQPKE
jgi:hypothetical protein